MRRKGRNGNRRGAEKQKWRPTPPFLLKRKFRLSLLSAAKRANTGKSAHQQQQRRGFRHHTSPRHPSARRERKDIALRIEVHNIQAERAVEHVVGCIPINIQIRQTEAGAE
jgi:hypothetical protein